MNNVNSLVKIVQQMEKDVSKLINVLHIQLDQDVLLIQIINYVHSNLDVIYNNVVMLLNNIQQIHNVEHLKKNVQQMGMVVF